MVGLGGVGAGKGAGRGPAHGYGRVRTCTTTPPNAQCRKTPIHTLKHMQSHKSTHVKPPPKSAKGTIGHPTLPTGWGGHEGVGVTRQRQMVVFGQTEDTCRLLAIYLFFLGILVLGALKKTLNRVSGGWAPERGRGGALPTGTDVYGRVRPHHRTHNVAKPPYTHSNTCNRTKAHTSNPLPNQQRAPLGTPPCQQGGVGMRGWGSLDRGRWSFLAKLKTPVDFWLFIYFSLGFWF